MGSMIIPLVIKPILDISLNEISIVRASFKDRALCTVTMNPVPLTIPLFTTDPFLSIGNLPEIQIGYRLKDSDYFVIYDNTGFAVNIRW